MPLEGPNAFTEQTRADEQQEVGHHDKEDSQGCRREIRSLKIAGFASSWDLLLRLANWYMRAPTIIPHMRPVIVAIGTEVAGWPMATPPTKTTTSRPVPLMISD